MYLHAYNSNTKHTIREHRLALNSHMIEFDINYLNIQLNIHCFWCSIETGKQRIDKQIKY